MRSDDPELSVALREAFLQGLDLPPDTAVGDLAFERHPNWDSLGHMSLVAAIERRFAVKLEPEEVGGLESFGSALAILGKRELIQIATPARGAQDGMPDRRRRNGTTTA